MAERLMRDASQAAPAAAQHRPVAVTIIAILVWVGFVSAAALLGAGGWGPTMLTHASAVAAAIVVIAVGVTLFYGLWTLRSWARSAVIWLMALALIYVTSNAIFEVSSQVFGGDRALSSAEIAGFVLNGAVKLIIGGIVPAVVLFALLRLEGEFRESLAQREAVDRGVRFALIATALSSILIVFLVIFFTLQSSWESIQEIGILTMLLHSVWRPNSGQFGVLPMIVGSGLSTLGAVVLGVPLSLGMAILLAEIAPHWVREVIRPAVELLAGIPSVVYGLFGMVVLAPLIREIGLPYNTGFGLLNASVILAVMILPTVASVSEDAIRAVPAAYKEGSLALGTTHWQTIWRVLLPAARSGIVAAIILGIGRALGETMALIMVIGNAIAMPTPLNNNPLTLFLSAARTLTGNIAVEINYASGVHKSSLFFTGVLLLVMILAINQLARYLMRERLKA
jgi:phosphate transport system permease protein